MRIDGINAVFAGDEPATIRAIEIELRDGSYREGRQCKIPFVELAYMERIPEEEASKIRKDLEKVARSQSQPLCTDIPPIDLETGLPEDHSLQNPDFHPFREPKIIKHPFRK